MCRNEKEIEDRKDRFGIRDSQDGFAKITEGLLTNLILVTGKN